MNTKLIRHAVVVDQQAVLQWVQQHVCEICIGHLSVGLIAVISTHRFTYLEAIRTLLPFGASRQVRDSLAISSRVAVVLNM